MGAHFERYEPESRKELLSLLEDAYLAENKELQFLERGFPCGQDGEIAALGQDGTGRLVLMEIFQKSEGLDLYEILKRYNWVVENRSILARIFKGEKVEVDKEPSLVLFAASSMEPERGPLSFLRVPHVGLYAYTCLEMDGKKGALLEEVYRTGEQGEAKGKDSAGADLSKEEREALKKLGKKIGAS